MKKQGFLKRATMLVLAGAMMIGGTLTAHAASGQWKQNATGWRWERGGGTYPANTWMWIDGDNDGKAECYYFDSRGYMLANTTTPDGYTVNADGAWTENGVVQTVGTNSDLHDVGAVNVADAASTNGAVTDGNSWAKMTFDGDLIRAMREVNSLNYLFPDRVQAAPGYPGQEMNGPTYAIQRNGKTITFGTFASTNSVADYKGPVNAFFGNFPEQGMELNAFYDNTGYVSLSAGRQPMGSTGNLDNVFGLPQGSYRMGWGYVKINDISASFHILLTEGEDGKYYIYPDSQMHVN